MPHHFADLLEQLRVRVSRMSALVQQSVDQAIQAVTSADARLAAQVIAADERIDEEEVQVERSAIDLLALYQPAAVDLRLVTSIIKVNSEFERIADCAVNIAQRVMPLAEGYEPPPDLQVMSSSVLGTLRDTIKAFGLTDEALARQVLRSDDVVDALYDQIVQDTLAAMQAGGPQALTDLANIMIAKNLERIGDHCMNIAEDVIYVCCGQIVRHLHAS